MKNTKFNWICVHCGKRNIDKLTFQFDVPQQYVVEWDCAKCGNVTKISFNFSTDLPTKKERLYV